MPRKWRRASWWKLPDLPSRLVDVNLRQEQDRLVQLQTSIDINRRVGSILDSDQLLHELAEIIRTRYAYDRSELYQWGEDEQCLRRHEPCAGSMTVTETAITCRWRSRARSGKALLGNHPIYVPDMRFSTRFPPDSRWPDTQSRVILPVRVGGKAIGVLDLHSNRKTLHTSRGGRCLAEPGRPAWRGDPECSALCRSRWPPRPTPNAQTTSRRACWPMPATNCARRSTSSWGTARRRWQSRTHTAPRCPMNCATDLRHIHQSGSHLVRLVDDLLSLSLAEIGALETVAQEVDSHALLAEVFEAMAGSRRSADVAWRLEVPDALPLLCADPVRLRQVLLNLLANAAENTASGHVVLRAAAQADCLDIWIEDTGRGIDTEDREHLNAYLSESGSDIPGLERHGFGIGLGLTVAYHIVRLHGGRMHVQSRPGHGTIAHVRLPLQPAHFLPAPEVTKPVLAASGPETQERILHNILEHASDLPRQVAQYITEHFATQISRDELALATQVSADYLSRVFRKETGMTPWQFLNRYRVLQAQKLLLSSKHSVTEIAAMVGFNDPAYFVRVFHRETGKAPQQYRKSAK